MSGAIAASPVPTVLFVGSYGRSGAALLDRLLAQAEGFVSIGDLVKYRIDRVVADAEAMRSYIQSA